MYFKKIDPDSSASRGDLEALVNRHGELANTFGSLVRAFGEFVHVPSSNRLGGLADTASRYRDTYDRLRREHDSLSPREGA